MFRLLYDSDFPRKIFLAMQSNHGWMSDPNAKHYLGADFYLFGSSDTAADCQNYNFIDQ
jgi:hypothetical protein